MGLKTLTFTSSLEFRSWLEKTMLTRIVDSYKGILICRIEEAVAIGIPELDLKRRGRL